MNNRILYHNTHALQNFYTSLLLQPINSFPAHIYVIVGRNDIKNWTRLVKHDAVLIVAQFEITIDLLGYAIMYA